MEAPFPPPNPPLPRGLPAVIVPNVAVPMAMMHGGAGGCCLSGSSPALSTSPSGSGDSVPLAGGTPVGVQAMDGVRVDGLMDALHGASDHGTPAVVDDPPLVAIPGREHCTDAPVDH